MKNAVSRMQQTAARSTRLAPGSNRKSSPPVWLMAMLLGLGTLVLYWPATRYDFINCDDPGFVTSNPRVQGGLSWEAVKWAFQTSEVDYWHPVTWLSLMADSSFFGRGAGGFHFTNLALHSANGALLFLVLRLLTRKFWRSALVAALFAWHPLRVESVVWVTERKDVLSGFFGLLALIFYARYARAKSENRNPKAEGNPKPEGRSPKPEPEGLWSISYLLSLGFFACGLMSKAMLVSLPGVMLLLDFWPLRRMQKADATGRHHAPRITHHGPRSTLPALRSTLLRLLGEKIPFFLLSALFCLVTFLTEQGRRAPSDLPDPSALLRIENALVAYARYLGKILWPASLALPYTNPGHWPWQELTGAALILAGLLVAAVWLAWRRPYVLMGCCWFFGSLLPVIGLTKGWGVFMADRFTYLPSIGLLIMVVWALADLSAGWRYRMPAMPLAGGAAVVLCLALTRLQAGYWSDSEALFRHTLKVNARTLFAHGNLAVALEKKGRVEEAIWHSQEAVRLNPLAPSVRNDLGVMLLKGGRADEAISECGEAIRLKPDYADAHNSLGNALEKTGRINDAIAQYQEAIRLEPDRFLAHNNLGIVLGKTGRMEEAIREFEEAIRLNPRSAEAHYNLGIALERESRTDNAIWQFQETLRLEPEHAEAHYHLAVALGRKGQADEAIRHFHETLRLKPEHAEAHYNLAVALGQKGDINEAIHQLQETLRLKPDHAQAHNNLGIALYQQGRVAEAIRQFQEAVKLRPDYADARRNLEAMLAAQAAASSPSGTHTNR
jgi:protein O-mannosyl-transferase